MRVALIRYARWLRARHEFPVSVPVYLLPGHTVRTVDGQTCSASFFAPFDRSVEPYIRIATGDYPSTKRRIGRDNALAGFLNSLSHEIVHYFQWIANGSTSERGVIARAEAMVDSYAMDVDRP